MYGITLVGGKHLFYLDLVSPLSDFKFTKKLFRFIFNLHLDL